jgi:hypothetical protein
MSLVLLLDLCLKGLTLGTPGRDSEWAQARRCLGWSLAAASTSTCPCCFAQLSCNEQRLEGNSMDHCFALRRGKNCASHHEVSFFSPAHFVVRHSLAPRHSFPSLLMNLNLNTTQLFRPVGTHQCHISGIRRLQQSR